MTPGPERGSEEGMAQRDVVSIRKLTPDDFALVASWLSDPQTNRLLTAEWRGRRVDPTVLAVAVRNRKNLFYVVESAGRSCGLVAFSEYETRDRAAMVWYVLGDRSLGGRGITTDAVRRLCSVGFSDLGLESIWAQVLSSNPASMRVLEKVGFKDAGRLRRLERVEDRQVDRHLYDLLPAEMLADPSR
jgi:RimJ/RimL family protein N-acetyltransferase